MAFKEILDLLIDIEKDERRINLTRPNIIVMHGEISLKVIIGYYLIMSLLLLLLLLLFLSSLHLVS